MKLPIDTTALSFICATEPEEDRDFTTREPRTNENGTPLWRLNVLAMGDGQSDLIRVRVPGPQKGVTIGSPVRLVGLSARQWDNNGSHGVAFRAGRVEPARPEGRQA